MAFKNKNMINTKNFKIKLRMFLISRHFSKGLFQLLSDCFKLLLLSNKFILKPVNLLLQLLDRFVCKFCSCFCLLQFGSEGFDLFLIRLLALVGFFFGYL